MTKQRVVEQQHRKMANDLEEAQRLVDDQLHQIEGHLASLRAGLSEIRARRETSDLEEGYDDTD